MKRVRWFVIALALLSAGLVRVESADQPHLDEQFGQLITRASMRLQEVSPKRPFQLASMNDSLTETARAALGMASSWSVDEIQNHIIQAEKAYPQNSFAFLLHAILLSGTGNEEASNQYFEEFLLRSRTFSGFEEPFLKWGEFHGLRRIVYHILQSRGVSFEGREKDIQVRIPYEQLIKYAMRPGTADRFMNIGFIIILVGGAAVVVLAAFMGVDFNRTIPGGLLGLYIATWVSYGTWIFDLAFGLPWGWSRFVVVPLFMGAVILLFIVSAVKEISGEYFRPVADGYRRCPKCRAVIEKLLIECPKCRARLE